MRSLCSFLLVLACSLCLIPPAHAQSGKGAITGRVTDSSGAALIGAKFLFSPRVLPLFRTLWASFSSTTSSLEAIPLRFPTWDSTPLSKQ